ncbi:permease [Streptomyces sp. NBC_00094]|uniref:permease n=1 Tax=Streptomyces sp. NBC_00094 TaxID=2903620 RepID=UPI002251CDA3|nr:permease [Streptomyces sp. NBC_00094]MCX5388996.1 permease [Streptomyces sp. NBC_00094]
MDELRALGLFILFEVLHYLPWFLVAIVLGIAVQRLSIDVVARRSFAHGRKGVLGIAIVTAIGAFSPFCSFTVIPLIRRFLIAGVPLSAVMSFWIASPSMDPEIYALSAAQLGLPIATARLIGALVLSFGAGLIVLLLERRGRFADPLIASTEEKAPAKSCSQETVTVPESACSATKTTVPETVTVGGGSSGGSTGSGGGSGSSGGCGGSAQETTEPADASAAGGCSAAPQSGDADDDGTPWRVLVRRDIKNLRAGEILKEIVSDSLILGKWLLLAIVLEALIVRYVPTDFVSGLLGTDGVFSVLLAGLISVPLYLNGVGAIPVVEGLLDQGMVAAAGVTFLLGGAITTIPAMVAVKSVVKTKVFAFYLAVGLLGSVGIGLVALPLL